MSQTIPQTKPLIKAGEGIFLVDKPTGITSHTVVNQVRKITGVRRVGHAGTLDPLATGLLIILVGRQYTKQQAKFLKQDKKYLCTIRLGLTTDSYDSDGKVIHETEWGKISKLTEEKIEQVLKSFRGKITQTVPPFSAVKQQGKKLYELARKGEIDDKDLPTRKVIVYELELTDFKKDRENKTLTISLSLLVSSGTYIRSIAHELGQQLKVGAIVEELRRIKIGPYSIKKSIKLD